MKTLLNLKNKSHFKLSICMMKSKRTQTSREVIPLMIEQIFKLYFIVANSFDHCEDAVNNSCKVSLLIQ
jgi:hypothetical protein